MAIAALAASIAGAVPALADSIYVWRPSEGLHGGQILPATAFATPPVSGGGVDFRSEDYGRFSNYTTRTMALAAGDFLSVPVPALFGFDGCRVLSDDKNLDPNNWVAVSIVGSVGKYNVAIRAKAPGRLELTVRCVTNTASETQTLWDEYLNLTISEA
jgi:hypothetical protein